MKFLSFRQFFETGEPRRLTAVSVALFPVRMFLGFGWLRAGIEKVIDARWWTGDHLRVFLAEQEADALPFMFRFIDHLFEPFSEVIVMAAQLIVGLCFVTGRRMRPALWAGITLNVVFVAMGAVDPSAFYLVIQLALLAAVGLGVFGGEVTRPSVIATGAMVGVAAGLVPLVTTLHPAEVIHDPAVILITVALLGAATESLRWFAHPRAARMIEPSERPCVTVA